MKRRGSSFKAIHEYHNKAISPISERNLRSKLWRWEQEPKDDTERTVIGIIGDVHAPFTINGYLEFCKETFMKHGVTIVVQIGDLVDNHAMSRHETETDADSMETEWDKTKHTIQKWYNAFPNMKLCYGNHDRIPNRLAKAHGIHHKYMRTINDVYGVPDTWEWADEHVINGVIFNHGDGVGGLNGGLNYANQRRCSAVGGHAHSIGEVRYNTNGTKLVFYMRVGCGFDHNAYAARYGKRFPKKPVHGCGIVFSDTEAIFVPFDKEKYGQYE